MSQTEKGAMDHPERVRVGAEDEAPPVEERRTLPPIAFPLLALLFTVALVWSFSQILLAVSHDIAPIIALLVAANVLIGSALVAYGSRVRRRPTSFPLLMMAGLAVVAGGFVVSTLPTEEEHAGGGGRATTLAIAAVSLEFDADELEIASAGPVRLRFDNNDPGVPHNVSIYEGEDASGTAILKGEIITGRAAVTYAFEAPPPGSYYFQCDVHPNMNGTVTVAEGGGATEGGTEAGGAEGGETEGGTEGGETEGGETEGGTEGGDTGTGGPGAGEAEIVAQNIAFTTNQLTVPAGQQATIHFDNRDPAPHNVAVYEGNDASGAVVFKGEVVTGPTTVDYTFEAPPPGEYYFQCDVHPNMNGTLTAT